jgi:hypothetical protein
MFTKTDNEIDEFIISHINRIKAETKVDFTIDISDGYPNMFPEVYGFTYRYVPYTFIVILPKYSNGTPWTEIYDAAILKIIEMEELQVTKVKSLGRNGDSVYSTTDYYEILKRKHLEDYQVNEILGTGGFSRTYYVTHNLNDIDYETILEGYDEEKKYDWYKANNFKLLKDAVSVFADPKTVYANKLETLKSEFESAIQPIIREYGEKFDAILNDFTNSNGYKVGDILKTTHNEFYVISKVSNYFFDKTKISFNHSFPETYFSFVNDDKVTNKDFSSITYYVNKINKTGVLSTKETWLYNPYIECKVGKIQDFKTAKELKKLIE